MNPWRDWEIDNFRAAVWAGASHAELAERFGRSHNSVCWGIRKYCKSRTHAHRQQCRQRNQERTLGQSLAACRADAARLRNLRLGWPCAENEPQRRALEALWTHGPLPFMSLHRLCVRAPDSALRLCRALRRLQEANVIIKGAGRRGLYRLHEGVAKGREFGADLRGRRRYTR